MTAQLELLAAEVSPASDWCQRWRDGGHTWRHRSEGGFDRARYHVAAVGEKAAKSFVERHHYSGSYPSARLRFGIYEADDLVGVAVLGVPMQAAVLTNVFPQLEACYESVELSRLVLLDRVPANAESWFLTRAFRLAAAEGVAGVVAFADPAPRRTASGLLFPGHVGITYQAKNATYCGRSTARTLRILPDGSTLSDRALSKVRNDERGRAYVERLLRRHGAPTPRAGETGAAWLDRALPAVPLTRVRHRGCHRYAFALRRRVRVALPAGRYPKAPDA